MFLNRHDRQGQFRDDWAALTCPALIVVVWVLNARKMQSQVRTAFPRLATD
jgi:hypothetical protein